MLVLNKYKPALILSLTKVEGFSTNLSICPLALATTTPYFEGSLTWVTIIVPCFP